MDRKHWNRRYAGSELVWTASANRFLVAEVADLSAGRALDLACGEGRNAVWLAEHDWEVTGVDFADVGLAKAATLAGERNVEVEWVEADLLEYVPEPNAFALVAVLYLHVVAAQRRRILARAADALAPGGVLLVIGHDSSNPEQGRGGPQDPAILFTAAEVAAELPDLTVERAETVRRAVGPPDEEAYAIDALVRATRS